MPVPARVEADGRFSTPFPVPPGVVTVRVFSGDDVGADGSGAQVAEAAGVVVRAGETAEAPAIDLRGRLARPEPAFAVEVRLDPKPALAADETLTLIATRVDVGGFTTATLGGRGCATLLFPTGGEWTLSATIQAGRRGPQVPFELVSRGEERRAIRAAENAPPVVVTLVGDPLAAARERIAEALDFLH